MRHLSVREMFPPQGSIESIGIEAFTDVQPMLQQDAERGPYQFLSWAAVGKEQSNKIA